MKVTLFTSAIALTITACSHGNENDKLIIEKPFRGNSQLVNQLYEILADDPNSGNYKFVLDTALKWEKAELPLTVCFLDGDKADRLRVKDAVSQWSESVEGKLFDFGKRKKPQDCKKKNPGENIRITFKGAALSTLRGTLGIKSVDVYEPTMKLGGFSETYPEKESEFQKWVLHEFGHALGLVHEHQGEDSKCFEEYDIDKLYERLQNAPYSWKRETAEKNIKTVYLENYHASTFDKKSIMMYTFPAKYYKDGDNSHCYHDPISDLSEQDKNFVQVFYTNNIDWSSYQKKFKDLYSNSVINSEKNFGDQNKNHNDKFSLSKAEAIAILKSKIESQSLSKINKKQLISLLE